MVSGKEIGTLIVALVGAFSLIEHLSSVSNVVQDASRLAQGDISAANDIVDSTVDEVVSEVEWNAGLAIAMTVCSALGLGVLTKILRRF